MCGIALTLLGRARLDLMLQSMKHRGPDAVRVTKVGEVHLGHARLAIMDTQDRNSRQPLWNIHGDETPETNQEGSYHAAFNGEIFNYKQLDASEGSGGSEIMNLSNLLWRKHDMTQFVNGYYAIVMHDIDRNSIVMARDLFGVIPLYYTLTPFEVASEKKALDQGSKIYEVPANTRLDYNLKTCKLKKTKFSQPFRMGTRRNAVNLRDSFSIAVHRAANHSDNGFSIAYSGGLDSSLVLKAVHDVGLEPTEIITVYTQTEDTREIDNARAFVKQLGWEHLHLCVPCHNMPEATLRHYIESPPNPIRDFAFKRHATVAMHATTKVILCGEGADELGLGYPQNRHNRTDVERYLSKVSSLKSQRSMTLDRVNKAGMMYSKEYRVPFLDVDFAIEALSNAENLEKHVFRDMGIYMSLPDYILKASKYTNEETVGRHSVPIDNRPHYVKLGVNIAQQL